MLLSRIRQAGNDGLTARIALALAGAATACVSLWLALAEQPLSYRSLFAGLALLGLYLVGLAILGRPVEARAILLSRFFMPIGIVCIALAMPIATVIRHSRALFKT